MRAFIIYTQLDWNELLPCAILAINNRIIAKLGMSPFFASHRYNNELFQKSEPLGEPLEPTKK